jgi:hypothetical protein
LSAAQCGVSLSHLLGADHGSTTSTAGGLVLRPSSCIFGKMHAYHRERWSSLFGIRCTSAPDDHSCVGSSALRVCVSWRWCWCLHPVCSVCALVPCTMFEGPPLAVLCGQGAKSCTPAATTFCFSLPKVSSSAGLCVADFFASNSPIAVGRVGMYLLRGRFA